MFKSESHSAKIAVMKILVPFSIVLVFFIPAVAQPCLNAAREVAPVLSPETRATYEKKLEEADTAHLDKPNAADSIIWLGRRMAYLGNYKKAVWIFSSGIKLHPNDAGLYRHRGHRYITLRCFDDAIRDLEKAASLIKGTPDEVELDGLLNARKVPTSTLQSNIWYHLGLAYYLKGDFASALRAYDECEKVSKNPDTLVATKHWQYMTLRRLGKKDEAEKAIENIPADLNIIENADYYTLIKLYRGKSSGGKLLRDFWSTADTLSRASIGYGLGNRWLYHNRPDEAAKVFRQIVAGNQWASFGYIAAETELKRQMKP
jgi:tetratricopeptide (TPR) repeat protein